MDKNFEFYVGDSVFIAGKIDAMYKDEVSGEHYRVSYLMDTLFDDDKTEDGKRLISDWIPEEAIYGADDYYKYLEEEHDCTPKKYTNLERIKHMSCKEFVNFLRYCDFNRVHPIVEGREYIGYTDVVAWLNEEV